MMYRTKRNRIELASYVWYTGHDTNTVPVSAYDEEDSCLG